MSMNMFFKAFKNEDIKKFLDDDSESLVGEYLDANKYVDSTDIEDTWDVIRMLIDDETGIISAGTILLDASEMGLTIKTSAQLNTIIENCAALGLTQEDIIKQVEDMGEDEEGYHQQSYQESPEIIADYIDHLIEFYKTAIKKELGVVSFVA